MIVAGVMSGTSADGIDVALVRVLGRGAALRFQLLHHQGLAYPPEVRRFILKNMNAARASVADLARLNVLLGELYADAVRSAVKGSGYRPELVGCHGQTLYHQGTPETFLGEKVACTWQSGEGAVVAARVGVPVVCDFRPSDMAAGGKGAPLVPFLDFLLFRHRSRGRIAQNLGGIANLTAIPAGAKANDVVAFDTGPGNMVIDALMQRHFRREFDRDGEIAGRGRVISSALKNALQHPFFELKPPRTAGREEFGREFVAWFSGQCGRAKPEDVIATATALTARSISDAVNRFVVSRKSAYRDFIISGGGANNSTLMRMLAAELEPLKLRVVTAEEFGIPSEAKEAVAFALLAYQTWNKQPSNVPAATGAKRAAILGKVCLP
jgi:anhydro-N-acetylmuramic acid kinase